MNHFIKFYHKFYHKKLSPMTKQGEVGPSGSYVGWSWAKIGASGSLGGSGQKLGQVDPMLSGSGPNLDQVDLSHCFFHRKVVRGPEAMLSYAMCVC